MILLKQDGTIEPFNLTLIGQTRWNLMAPTKDRTEEADEYDGEVDFGAEFQPQQLELHCVTQEGLSIEQKYQKKVEIANICNQIRNGDWLMLESVPNRKIFARFAGSVQIEEYPSWLRVIIPLKLDPFWISAEENTFSGAGVIVNAGTFETPVIIDILASPNAVTSPAIGIGDNILSYLGTIPKGNSLIINTEKMTVIIDDNLGSPVTNALGNYDGPFPQLPPGETSVSVSAYAGSPVVTFYWHDKWI